MISGKKGFAAALALALFLTGCGSSGSNGGAAEANANPGGGQQAPGQQDRQGQGPGQGGPLMATDLIGKIKSVDGNTITLYKSSFQPGDRGGGPGGGGNPSGQGQDGEPPADGQPPAGGDGQAPQGEGRQRPDMSNMFSEETVDIRVTAGTKIARIAFANQERTETELTLADLKADDIVSVDLEDGSQNAASITLNEGGFGGIGGMGGGRGEWQQGEAPAAQR